MRKILGALVLGVSLPLHAPAADFHSYAFVNDDGTLDVGRATIHLYGILIPPTETTCLTFVRPMPCGPRAVLALEFNIGTDFVKCDSKGRNEDGSYVAVCEAGGEDLAATLLGQGWAVALPHAPYEYKVLERIARERGIGVWGVEIQRRLPRK